MCLWSVDKTYSCQLQERDFCLNPARQCLVSVRIVHVDLPGCMPGGVFNIYPFLVIQSSNMCMHLLLVSKLVGLTFVLARSLLPLWPLYHPAVPHSGQTFFGRFLFR